MRLISILLNVEVNGVVCRMGKSVDIYKEVTGGLEKTCKMGCVIEITS